jgi:hypothetical protein
MTDAGTRCAILRELARVFQVVLHGAARIAVPWIAACVVTCQLAFISSNLQVAACASCVSQLIRLQYHAVYSLQLRICQNFQGSPQQQQHWSCTELIYFGSACAVVQPCYNCAMCALPYACRSAQSVML